MALALAYTQAPKRRAFDRIVVSGPDAHGVATLAARLRVLQQRGENVLAVSRFPDTLPANAHQAFDQIAQQYDAVRGTEVIDIPVNVRQPDAFIAALSKLPKPIYFYDHHETSVPFVQRLSQYATPIITADAVQMAVALELFSDEVSKELAIVGIVADRDPAVAKIVSRDAIEGKYLELANRLDILVRNPRLANASNQAELAGMLAQYGIAMLEQLNVQYPPDEIAKQVPVVETGDAAIVVDFTGLDPAQTSMWIPKTMEKLAIWHQAHIVIAIAPGFNPRAKTVEGYDVRVIKYWLSDYPLTAEELAKDVIQRMAPQGRVVGHENYVSIRFSTVEEAKRIAEEIFNRAEGRQPSTAHLVNDALVANAIRRDYQKLYEILERIAKALERGAAAKERQVQLIEEDIGRRRYD